MKMKKKLQDEKRKKVMEYLEPRDPQKDVLLEKGLVRGGDGIIRLSVVSEGKTDQEWFEHLARFHDLDRLDGMREIQKQGFPTTNNSCFDIEIIPGFYWNFDRFVDPIRINRDTRSICKFGELLGLRRPPAEVAFLLWDRLNATQKDWQVGITDVLTTHEPVWSLRDLIIGFELASTKMWAVKSSEYDGFDNTYGEFYGQEWPRSWGFALMVEPWAKREF